MKLSRKCWQKIVLGIETSCDDTAVAILNSKREILAAERFTNRKIQQEIGGISPIVCAEQHRKHLPILIEKCIFDAGISKNELDAIAVTSTPGLVIALKEGIGKAIQLARDLNRPLIPVHHMRAHALSIYLSEYASTIKFPFSTFLISGGHALIAIAKSAEEFELYGKSLSGSPGECLDKVAREISIPSEYSGIHAGAAIEKLAENAETDGYLKYAAVLPSTSGADMQFSQLKSTYLNLARKRREDSDFSVENFCASLQHSVAAHISSKLHSFFEQNSSNQLVVGGGVAANQYIFNAIQKVAKFYNCETFQVPLRLCSDNAEMITLTGLMMLELGSSSIIPPDKIPDTIYAHARTEIGIDCRHKITPKPSKRLIISTINGHQPIRFSYNRK
ncbi:unnamed protein product [Caenorhabditis angaria]|uniref:N(6)-L-threonylcarbamoyladenine synthase n=1 Tax=Caenorhabditis angaria TaxID=860376 RepID=A0A9P1N579_9PELO|nr:unnamed protein product [Caenorhabditis angaria]